MRYTVLATDYDGTLATDGVVGLEEMAALERLRASGRRLVLVTGRELEDLLSVFPRAELFDRVVAENGALVFTPEDNRLTRIAEPPPEAFVAALRARGVLPLSVGHVIVATWEPNETVVLDTIRELGLELQVIFNKGAVMVLPSGVNKATGLSAALHDLSLSRHNAVGIGDAENDHAFLAICECGVTVANALPVLKERADLVTEHLRGPGVIELVDRLLATDLRELDSVLKVSPLRIGTRADEEPLTLAAYGHTVMIAGASGSGKSTLATAVLEQLVEHEYQFCLIDPEGDYATLKGAVVLGDAEHVPAIAEVTDVLTRPDQSLVVCLLGVKLADRPGFFQELLAHLGTFRAKSGRPHWIVLDEAHHLLPTTWQPGDTNDGSALGTALLITVHPDHVSPAVLASVDVLVAVGPGAPDVVRVFARGRAIDEPSKLPVPGEGEALSWRPVEKEQPVVMRPETPTAERLRHRRKYAQGTLGPDRSFYFRGPHNKLQLRAQNLETFIQLAEGIDDETWLHHLQNGDYSRWVADAIKDEELAQELAALEQRADLPAAESRKAVIEAIRRQYTHPA